EPAAFSQTSSGLQSGVGTPAKASTERTIRFWHDTGRRSADSDQSCAGPAIRAAVVFTIRALSRDAAFSCAGRNALAKSTASSHGRIQSARAQISRLSPG